MQRPDSWNNRSHLFYYLDWGRTCPIFVLIFGETEIPIPWCKMSAKDYKFALPPNCYGEDSKPGIAETDDNGDGIIDNDAEWLAGGSDDIKDHCVKNPLLLDTPEETKTTKFEPEETKWNLDPAGDNVSCYGPDGKPGIAGIDDDGDTYIDYLPGPDGAPGIAGIDDNMDGTTDDTGELGWQGSDDIFDYKEWQASGSDDLVDNCGENDGIRQQDKMGNYIEDTDWENRNKAADVNAFRGPGIDDTGIDGTVNFNEPGFDPDCNMDPNNDNAYPPFHVLTILGIPPTPTCTYNCYAGNGTYERGELFLDYGLDGVPDQLETGANGRYSGPDPDGDDFSTGNISGTEKNDRYDPGEPWGSKIFISLIDMLLGMLPELLPQFGMKPEEVQNTVNAINAIPGISTIIVERGLATFIYLSDVVEMTDALSKNINDNTGSKPLDLVPFLVNLTIRVLTSGVVDLGSTSELGGILTGMLSRGLIYEFGLLPAIDISVIYNHPVSDLKLLFPLYAGEDEPFVDLNANGVYDPPEPFADGSVYMKTISGICNDPPDPALGCGWQIDTSRINGTCDNCTGNPSDPDYTGEYYADLNENGVWDAGEPFTDLSNDFRYQRKGDFYNQTEVELFFDLDGNGQYTQFEFNNDDGNNTYDPGECAQDKFIDINNNGICDIANAEPFSDTGIDGVATMAEPGYQPDSGSPYYKPDPNFDGTPSSGCECNFGSFVPPIQPYPAPCDPSGMSTILPLWCGEADRKYSSGETYHIWPDGRAIDKPNTVLMQPFGISGMSPMPIVDFTYLFFPEPSFNGILTTPEFHYGDGFYDIYGLREVGAQCGTVTYDSNKMTNAQLNIYINLFSNFVPLFSSL